MTILKTLRTGCALLTLAVPAIARAHPPVSVVMDSHGNVYFSDLSNVWQIATNGSVSIVVHHVHSHQLYLGPGDTLLGEHLWYNGDSTRTWGYRVWKRAPDGTVSDVVPPPTGFRTDYSLVRDAAGTQYWIDCDGSLSVGARRSDGTVTHRRTAAGCTDPLWLWSDPSGALFYADKGVLQRVSPTGEVISLATHLNGHSLTQVHVSAHHSVLGIWTDAGGAVYVANYRGRQVWRVPSDGGAPRVVARSPVLWGPTGGLVAPSGDLWVLESSLWNSVRVRRIRPDGQVTVFAARAR